MQLREANNFMECHAMAIKIFNAKISYDILLLIQKLSLTMLLYVLRCLYAGWCYTYSQETSITTIIVITIKAIPLWFFEIEMKIFMCTNSCESSTPFGVGWLRSGCRMKLNWKFLLCLMQKFSFRFFFYPFTAAVDITRLARFLLSFVPFHN